MDIIGVADSPNKLETPGKTFNCGVRGRRTMREESPVLTTEIYGVLTRHPWIGQVSADHDLDEDLFSLAVKRAGAYGWSTTLLGAQNTLGGQRWEHADAGGDWSQDGQEHRVAWLTVYPAADMRGQHLRVLPMVRTLTDALQRVGRLRFTELRVHAPPALARDAGFDLRAAADWFALSSPEARTDVMATARTDAEAARAAHLGPGCRPCCRTPTPRPLTSIPAPSPSEASAVDAEACRPCPCEAGGERGEQEGGPCGREAYPCRAGAARQARPPGWADRRPWAEHGWPGRCGTAAPPHAAGPDPAAPMAKRPGSGTARTDGR
ncbi:hypothetical protein ABT144_34310 [Streptomyces sp. NPDC002039]|uniref:hypothetical protein n=1 Tax=Streptomyces sp. NPDC002039 TaxID=3154660 RepID=UPI00331FCEBD